MLKKAAAPLATGALSGLASLGVNKLFGKGFHISDQKVKQLIKYKDHLTPKQKQDIVMALKKSSGVDIKPTKKQIGNGIWSILASIAAPMILDSILGKGLQVDRERSRRSLPIHVPKPTTKQRDGGLVLPVDYRSPPFIGSWDQKTNNMLGYGKPKKRQKKNDKKREKDS